MLHVYNRRFLSAKENTLGLFSIGSEGQPICFILEDEKRNDKVYGETRIPEGAYPLDLRTVGGFHSRYSERFADDDDIDHRGMIWLRNVPNFEYVLIHIGNDDEDTAGCLLTGYSANLQTPNFIGYSEDSYKKIYTPIADHLEQGKPAILHVKNMG